MKEITDKNISKLLIFMIILALFPSIILENLNFISNSKNIVWVMDAIYIILMFLICLFKFKNIQKSKSLPLAIVLSIAAIQYLVYISSLNLKLLELIYIVLPILYAMHFIFSYIILGNLHVQNIDLSNFFKFFLSFVIIACIFNIVKNFNFLIHISSINSKYINLSSFFSHRNAFGQILYLGIFCNTFLFIKSKLKKPIYLICYIILIYNLIFTFSRASIFSSLIFLLLYFFLDSNNQKKFKLFVTISFIAILILIIFNNKNIFNFINYYILRFDDGLSGRDKLWHFLYQNLIGYHILFGYGLGSTPKLLSKFMLSNSHNLILELLMSGGIILLLAYVCVYINIWLNIKKIKNKNIKNLYYSFFVSFIFYTLFEKVLIFGTGYAAAIFTIMFLIIPLLLSKNLKN